MAPIGVDFEDDEAESLEELLLEEVVGFAVVEEAVELEGGNSPASYLR